MPLKKLVLKPGVNRESTSLANEGTWFESDKVRFRSGYPEKIGGWEKDTGTADAALEPPAGSFWGVCRHLFNWLTLSGYNLLGVGTHLKYYIQNSVGGSFYDVTPLRETTVAGAVTFAAVNGSSTITVSDTAHGATENDFVTFSGAVSLGGNVTAAILNAEHQIASVVNSNSYTIVVSVTANASDTGDGGAAVVGAYQIQTGSETYTVGVGWGAGGWSGVTTGYPSTGWGEAAPAGVGIGFQLRLWSASNFGENLIINPRAGALYLWDTNADPDIFDRATLLTSGDTPEVANYVLVSDNSRFVLAFGVNDYGSSAQDPMLVRWSDQESYTDWTPAATNQAGSYRLSRGSQIITARQTRQEVLVWTDAAIYSMQYLGPPYVWGTQILADNISIVSPNAVAVVNNITYWMGVDKFYVYSGRVETLPCTLRQYIFDDFSRAQGFQVHCGTNEGYNEVWWFYCSLESDTVDRYVIYNYVENTWAYGTMERTAWLDSPLRSQPSATGYDGQLFYHEVGNDDGSTSPPSAFEAYVQTADFDIDDGDHFGLVWRLIPDVTFDGSTVNAPEVYYTLRPRQNPGAGYGPALSPTVASTQNYSGQRTYTVQQFTQQVTTRVRGRHMALKISSTGLGVAWQVGAPRIDVKPDGRR